MYYVFRNQIIEINGKILHARVLNDTRNSVPNFIQSIAYATPFEKPMLNMSFLVPGNVLLPDNLFTGTGLSLYSERLIRLLGEEEIPFQEFEVSLVDKVTQQEINQQYFIFHLLRSFEGIDKEASDIDGLTIRDVVLTTQCLEQQPLLFRDSVRRDIVLMHTDLKEKLEKHGIGGCEFIFYQDYQHIFGALESNRKSARRGRDS